MGKGRERVGRERGSKRREDLESKEGREGGNRVGRVRVLWERVGRVSGEKERGRSNRIGRERESERGDRGSEKVGRENELENGERVGKRGRCERVGKEEGEVENRERGGGVRAWGGVRG